MAMNSSPLLWPDGYSVLRPRDDRLTPMDFDLTEDQRAFQATARQFARDEMAPKARDWDENETFPVAGAAPGGGARLRRHLCEGRRRRLGAVAARRHHHLRGAGAGLHLDRRLYLDPQHGGLDDRRLRRRGAAQEIPAEALHHGAFRELLPDRAGLRLRRREPEDQGRARRRPLRAQRHRRPSSPAAACPTSMSAWCAPAARGRRAFPASWSRRARRAFLSARRRRSSAGNRSRPRW